MQGIIDRVRKNIIIQQQQKFGSIFHFFPIFWSFSSFFKISKIIWRWQKFGTSRCSTFLVASFIPETRIALRKIMESRENSTFIVSASGKKRRVRARARVSPVLPRSLFPVPPVLVLILVFVLLFFSRFADAAKRFRKGSPPRLRFVVPLAFPRIQPRVCLCRACLPLTQRAPRPYV